jgi:hypothetical protein
MFWKSGYKQENPKFYAMLYENMLFPGKMPHLDGFILLYVGNIFVKMSVYPEKCLFPVTFLMVSCYLLYLILMDFVCPYFNNYKEYKLI